MKKKIAFKTLGCRLNQSESNALASKFQQAGYEIVPFSDEADVYVINTCTVTNQSDHKSRNVISQAHSRVNKPVLIVVGCMVNNQLESLQKLGYITYLVKNEEKNAVFSMVENHFYGHAVIHEKGNMFDYPVSHKIFRTRGMVKIQDGCDSYCTYCIVPYVRGGSVSRPLSDIIQHVNQLIVSGYKEIVITGVNIGSYSYNGSTLSDVLVEILHIEGDFRIRVSSIEPEGIDQRFVDLLSHPKICPHLHICVQSGSEKIVKSMNRRSSVSDFVRVVHDVRKINPLFNITTDIMVGFPGEGEEDFSATINLINQVRFGHIHTFKYSTRNGTLAAGMKDQIPERIKSERSRIIRDLSQQHKNEYRQQFIGQTQRVLIERKNADGFYTGYGEYYIPVKIPSSALPVNSFQKIRIIDVDKGSDYMIGEVM